MSNHYLAINRGREGLTETDFVEGTASSAASDIELRIADAATLSRIDVLKALDAFKLRINVRGLNTSLPNARI